MRRLAGLLALALIGTGAWLLRPAAPGSAPATGSTGPQPPATGLRQRSPDRISQADLPPPGSRSLFDHHLARLGGLPYPFTALLDSFKALDRWDQGSVGLLIPDGRSLAKGHADYRQPRVLAAAQLDPPEQAGQIAPIYSGRLFLGYVEAIDTIEIIAYNETAGRFEFQLVKDYCAGCSPRVSYAQRAICTACHQSGAPIFARRPWSESNAHRAVAERIASARGVPWPQASSSHYHGLPLSTQILMPESFDERVAQGSALLLAQQAWIDGCGENGLDCRRQLLAQALSLLLEPGAFHPQSAANQRLRALQRANWPAAGLALAEHRLADRLPPAPPFYASWLRPLQALWARLQAGDQARRDSASRLAELARLPPIPVAQDPLSPRPPVALLDSESLQGVHAVAGLFSVQDRQWLRGWGGQTRLRALIRQGALDPLLGPAPLSRVAILQQLARAQGLPVPGYCCRDTQALAAPRQETAPQLAIRRGSVLELFRDYCFACHRGNPVAKLNFMGGDSEAEILAAIRAAPRIRTVLDHDGGAQLQRMPPPSSTQRARLDAARRRGADDLQRMQQAVTGAD